MVWKRRRFLKKGNGFALSYEAGAGGFFFFVVVEFMDLWRVFRLFCVQNHQSIQDTMPACHVDILPCIVSLDRGQVPPNVHFSKLNPTIDLDDFAAEIPITTTALTGTMLSSGQVSCLWHGICMDIMEQHRWILKIQCSLEA